MRLIENIKLQEFIETEYFRSKVICILDKNQLKGSHDAFCISIFSRLGAVIYLIKTRKKTSHSNFKFHWYSNDNIFCTERAIDRKLKTNAIASASHAKNALFAKTLFDPSFN